MSSGIRITITPDARSMAEARRRISALLDLGRSPQRPLGLTGEFVRRMGVQLLRQRQKKNPMTGKLARSLTYRLERESVIIGSNLVYAAIQQVGGTIKPKPGKKFLAIPVKADLRRNGMWPSDFPKGALRFVAARQKKGDVEGYLFRAQQTESSVTGGKRKGPTRLVGKVGELLYILVSKTTIKGQEYLVFQPPAQRFLIAELIREAQRRWQGGR